MSQIENVTLDVRCHLLALAVLAAGSSRWGPGEIEVKAYITTCEG